MVQLVSCECERWHHDEPCPWRRRFEEMIVEEMTTTYTAAAAAGRQRHRRHQRLHKCHWMRWESGLSSDELLLQTADYSDEHGAMAMICLCRRKIAAAIKVVPESGSIPLWYILCSSSNNKANAMLWMSGKKIMARIVGPASSRASDLDLFWCGVRACGRPRKI